VKKLFLNGVEIGNSSQFHQHFASSFCANIPLPKKIKAKLLEKSCAMHFGTKKADVKYF